MEISKLVRIIRIVLGVLSILGIIFASYLTAIKNDKIEDRLTAIYVKKLDEVESISAIGSNKSFTVDLILNKEIDEEEKKKVTNELKIITCKILVDRGFSEINSININLREYNTANHIFSRIINRDKCILPVLAL